MQLQHNVMLFDIMMYVYSSTVWTSCTRESSPYAETGLRIILEAQRTTRTVTMLNHRSWTPFTMKRISIYVLWPTKGSMEF